MTKILIIRRTRLENPGLTKDKGLPSTSSTNRPSAAQPTTSASRTTNSQ